MGWLNVAGYGLLVGAMGQGMLLARFWPNASLWSLLPPLLVPWLTVHAITFCKPWPTGPVQVRQCFRFAMRWYVAATILAEAAAALAGPPPQPKSPEWVAHLLVAAGFLPFIPLTWTCGYLQRIEKILARRPQRDG